MSIDINAKAAQLLERLANSIYDREQGLMQQHFCFNIAEVHITEQFLKETINEAIKNIADY